MINSSRKVLNPLKNKAIFSLQKRFSHGTDETIRPDVDIRIVEVGPRDGLQNEAKYVDKNVKIEFINRLSRTGLRNIEATR